MNYTIGDLRNFIDGYYKAQANAKNYCLFVLEELGGVCEWNWKEEDTPSVDSTSFDGDVADCYLTKIWIDSKGVMGNLYGYYNQIHLDNVNLYDELNLDWVDLLDYLLYRLEQKDIKKK